MIYTLQIDAGYLLTCQALPMSDLNLIVDCEHELTGIDNPYVLVYI